MKAAHSSGTPSTRQRPKVDAVVLERFPSVHEQGSCELIGRPFDAASELGLLLLPGVVPRVQVLVSDGVRHHPPLPRRADTLGPFHQNAGMHLLEHVRRPPSPSRPGRLAAVSSSTWPRRSRSRLTCAPLFCVLVIRGDLFARRSATRLFRFTHVLGPPQVGRPLPSTSRSDASPASQRCREGRLRSLPSHLSSARPMGLPLVAPTLNLAIPYGVAKGENEQFGQGILTVFVSAVCLV